MKNTVVHQKEDIIQTSTFITFFLLEMSLECARFMLLATFPPSRMNIQFPEFAIPFNSKSRGNCTNYDANNFQRINNTSFHIFAGFEQFKLAPQQLCKFSTIRS